MQQKYSTYPIVLHQTYVAGVLAFVIAMVTTIASNPASAFELDIYGVGHVSADLNDDGDDSQGYIASNSSRLGIRAKQALDNGLHVGIQYESGVDLTGRGTNDGNGPGTSNNLFSTSRDSFVSLGGGFGTVTAGRLGVLNQWVYDYNLFADQIGDLGNIWGGTGIPGRDNGMIAYTTPTLGMGLQGFAGYIPESGTDNADILVLKLNLNHNSGLKAGLGYSNLGDGNFGPGADDQTAFVVTASYSAGPFSVGGGYQSDSDIGGASGNDRDSYTVGGSYNFGSATVKAQYTTTDADANNADAEMIAVGVDYALNKATTVYAAYASTDNDSNSAFTANNYGHGQAVSPLAGDDPSSFSVGIVYKFDANIIK